MKHEFEKIVLYFGQDMKVACDGKCNKAWGINERPKNQLSDDEDDFEYFSDDELETAPEDPGTYEGGHAKPLSNTEFPNKWCVRECERCSHSSPGKSKLPLELRDFSKRKPNIPL